MRALPSRRLDESSAAIRGTGAPFADAVQFVGYAVALPVNESGDFALQRQVDWGRCNELDIGRHATTRYENDVY